MSPIEVRMAIWMAHKKKDAYTGQLIENFDDLEIDHIIPQSIDENQLAEKINLYELGENFTVRSLENLLPTFKLHNRQKSKMVFQESSERFFLALARERKDRVEKELSKIIKNRKLKEKIQFKKSYKINDTDQYGLKPTYFNSDSLVALNGFLPSKFENIGSCAIEFYEMGTMITLNHELILTLIHETAHSTLEGQILNYYNKDTQKVFVILGSSSLHLKKEAYDQMLIILGDYLKNYKIYISGFETFWGLKDFEKWGNTNMFKIGEIEEREWKYLTSMKPIDSALQYEAGTDFLIITDNNSGIPKCTFSVQNSILLWHLPTKQARELIVKGEVWTAREALNWISHISNPHTKSAHTSVKNKRNWFYIMNELTKKLFGRR